MFITISGFIPKSDVELRFFNLAQGFKNKLRKRRNLGVEVFFNNFNVRLYPW